MSKQKIKKVLYPEKVELKTLKEIKLPYGLKPNLKTRTAEEIHADRPQFAKFLM